MLQKMYETLITTLQSTFTVQRHNGQQIHAKDQPTTSLCQSLPSYVQSLNIKSML